jgi:multiple antibiotic resistance protein
MPILIGPGTISVSVLIGKRLSPLNAALSIAVTVFISAGTMVLLKMIHDYIKPRKEALIEQYMETAGKIMALYIGAFSVNMIMSGIGGWIEKFPHFVK